MNITIAVISLGLVAGMFVPPAKPTRLTIKIDDVAEMTLPYCDASTEGDMMLYKRKNNTVPAVLSCDGKKWNIEGVAGGGDTLEKPPPAKDKA
jgi:hypothetical protein